MNPKINLIILIILVVCLPIIIIIASANSVIFSDSTYSTAKEIELKKETINNILNYFKNDQEFLIQPEFTQREVTHMADVKKVIKNMNSLLFFCVVISTISLIYASTRLNIKDFKKFISKYLKIGSTITIIIILILFFSALNFDFTFNLFHSLLFQQGTWLFPENSMLIQLFPITFFQQITFGIFSRIFIFAIVLLVGAFYLKKPK